MSGKAPLNIPQQKPFQINYSGGIGINPNKTTVTSPITGANTGIPTTPANGALFSTTSRPLMGIQAKAPQQNVPVPKNTIAPQFVQTPPPISTVKPDSASLVPSTPQSQTLNVATPQGNQEINPNISGILPFLFRNAYQNPQIAQTQQQISDLSQQEAQQLANIGGSRTNLAEAGGEQGLLQNLFANKLGALQTQLGQQTAEQQLQQQALSQALGAVSPQAVPYSSQYISPVTGQPIAGAQAGTIPGNVQDAASLYASRVLSGGMTYDQAVQALSQYGPVGQQQLTQALGPNFSTVQSNINAAIQGQLGPAAQNAANQLQNLQTTMQTSPGLIATGIPVLNTLMRTLSSLSGVGAGSTQALSSALTDARAAMANALGVANNSTPSTYDEYVKTLLPDGLTPDQLTNAITQFTNQIQGKLQAYKTPGTTQYQATPEIMSPQQFEQTIQGKVDFNF